VKNEGLVLPGLVAIMALSALYVAFCDATVITRLFLGLAPAVIAIVQQAVQRPSLVITGIACMLIFALRWFVLRTLGLCAVLGIGTQLVLSAL
jgi:chromate transporter